MPNVMSYYQGDDEDFEDFDLIDEDDEEDDDDEEHDLEIGSNDEPSDQGEN